VDPTYSFQSERRASLGPNASTATASLGGFRIYAEAVQHLGQWRPGGNVSSHDYDFGAIDVGFSQHCIEGRQHPMDVRYDRSPLRHQSVIHALLTSPLIGRVRDFLTWVLAPAKRWAVESGDARAQRNPSEVAVQRCEDVGTQGP
jgi:hypothetical protein